MCWLQLFIHRAAGFPPSYLLSFATLGVTLVACLWACRCHSRQSAPAFALLLLALLQLASAGVTVERQWMLHRLAYGATPTLSHAIAYLTPPLVTGRLPSQTPWLWPACCLALAASTQRHAYACPLSESFLCAAGSVYVYAHNHAGGDFGWLLLAVLQLATGTSAAQYVSGLFLNTSPWHPFAFFLLGLPIGFVLWPYLEVAVQLFARVLPSDHSLAYINGLLDAGCWAGGQAQGMAAVRRLSAGLGSAAPLGSHALCHA